MLRRLGSFGFYLGITERDLELDEFLNSPYVYEEALVKILETPNDVMTANNVMDHLARQDCVMKLEGYEKFSATLFNVCRDLAVEHKHIGPVTAHVFVSPAEGKSFPMHTDPDDVVVYMVRGEKYFISEGIRYDLKQGDALFIPHDVPHQAFNVTDNVMISFGLEKFICEKL